MLQEAVRGVHRTLLRLPMVQSFTCIYTGSNLRNATNATAFAFDMDEGLVRDAFSR